MPQILFSPRLVANGASYVRIFVLGTDFGRFTISSFLVVAETFILAKNRSDYNRLRRDQGGSNPPDDEAKVGKLAFATTKKTGNCKTAKVGPQNTKSNINPSVDNQWGWQWHLWHSFSKARSPMPTRARYRAKAPRSGDKFFDPPIG